MQYDNRPCISCVSLLYDRAGKNSLAAPVLAVCTIVSQVKNKILFLQKQVIDKNASVILDLLGLLYS